MTNPKKPAGLEPMAQPAKPLTNEEKKARVLQFLSQKREAFSLNILCNLCKAVGDVKAVAKANGHLTELTIDTYDLVDKSVDMADHLIEKLYPLPEDTDKKPNN